MTTGTFTIPLMKRVGYSAVKAGAIECAAGVNGQLMPPVMGAAAFLIAEYVGITYAEVVKHAFLPAFLTYGALFYIVDIEAVKMGLRGLPRSRAVEPAASTARGLMTICGIIILSGLVYWGIGWIKIAVRRRRRATSSAPLAGRRLCRAARLQGAASRPAARRSDAGHRRRCRISTTRARTGLHYLLPVVVLIWCLMVEELSPGLSAFWGAAFLIVIMLTQRPLIAAFRGEAVVGRHPCARAGPICSAALEGAARNMTGVGIATATAGIIVGTVALTGVGLVMTEIVETVSGGNLIDHAGR